MLRLFSAAAGKVFRPLHNIMMNATKYVIEYELPGVGKDDLDVSCQEDNVLVLKAKKNSTQTDDLKLIKTERNFGRFESKLQLPKDAITDEIDASLSLGVLTIAIPRIEKKKEPTKVRIPIKY